jgi:hypothetical protein
MKHLPFITTLYVLRPTRFDVCVGVVVCAFCKHRLFVTWLLDTFFWACLLIYIYKIHTHSIYTVLYLHYLAVNVMWYIGTMLI